jgi:hypothetical protein
MVVYTCKRCGYNTQHKSSFKNHLNRKNICAPLLDNISIDYIKHLYNLDIVKHIAPKQHLNSTQIAPFDTFSENLGVMKTAPKSQLLAPKMKNTSTQIAPKIIQNLSYICDFCDKTFTRKTGLNKHKKCCKIKKLNENKMDLKYKKLEKSYEELKDQVEDLLINLSKSTRHTTNNTNNTNNTHNDNSNNTVHNTININNYGSENLEYLNKDYLTNLLNTAFTAIPKLIEKIHFNPKHPENHNIKITNKKQPYVKVRKNDKWELKDKKETLENLVDDKYNILEDHYVEKTEEINVMDNFIDKYQSNYDLQKELQKKTEIVILNNS